MKKQQVEKYFTDKLSLMQDIPKNLRFAGGLKDFSSAFQKGLESQEYKDIVNRREDGLKTFNTVFGFYDVFLISPEGNVSDASKGVSEIAQNISGVSAAARETTQGSSHYK